MARPAAAANPPCPRCGHDHTVRTGRTRGRQRWFCTGCGQTFGPTPGTPLFRVRPPAAAVAQAVLIVQRRGSRLAAADRTGHTDAPIGRWRRRAGAHATARTATRGHARHLTAVDVDQFWSFVHDQGGPPPRARPPRTHWGGVSAGAA